MQRRQETREFANPIEQAVDVMAGIPMLRRFLTTGTDDKFYSQNYATIRDVVEQKSTLRESALKAGDVETAKEVLRDNPLEVVTMAPRIKETEKQLRTLRDTTRELRSKLRLGTLTTDDYNTKMEAIRVKSNMLKEKAVKMYFDKVQKSSGY
jgi:hypothetical protein